MCLKHYFKLCVTVRTDRSQVCITDSRDAVHRVSQCWSSVSSGSVELLADGLLGHLLHSPLNNVATTTKLCPSKMLLLSSRGQPTINKMVTMQIPDKIWMLFILWKWQKGKRVGRGLYNWEGDDVKKDFNLSQRKGLNSMNNRHKTFLS